MAKSLRSKWKRKMRAIKRERYGQKELAHLKKILGIEDENGDIEMSNVAYIATVTDAKSIRKKTKEKSEVEVIEKEEAKEGHKEKMEVDEVKSKYHKKTLRNEHGHYPEWMSPREVKKRSIANRLKKQKVKRKRIKDKRKRKN